MKISVFSFLWAVLWSGILISVSYWIRKKHFLIKQFGVAYMTILYLFCAIRMILPIDFSSTKGIYLEGKFAEIYDALCFKKYRIGTVEITPLAGLVMIWLTIAGILLLHFAHEYRSMKKLVRCYEKREDIQCANILQKVFESKTGRKISVSKSKDVAVPMGIGIWDRTILLPDKDYSDQELYYILLHESTHFLNKDLLVKMLIHIYCCVFWWNPIIYLLRKDLDQTLEIKCDLHATEDLSPGDTADYLRTIVETLKDSSDKTARYGAAALVGHGGDEVVERFQVVLKNQINRGTSKGLIVICSGILMFLICASYSFLPVPVIQPPIEEIITGPNTYELTPDNSYIVRNGNGKYYWIMEGVMNDEIDQELALELEVDGFDIREET